MPKPRIRHKPATLVDLSPSMRAVISGGIVMFMRSGSDGYQMTRFEATMLARALAEIEALELAARTPVDV